jgi:uncharacterized protein (TIGR02265 family)
VTEQFRGVPFRTFESVLRKLQVDEAMLGELVAAGFDPRRPEDEYSAQTLRSVIEVVRQHRFPALEREAGLRELGRIAAEGLNEGVVGAVFASILPNIGTERFVMMLPRFVGTARPDATLRLIAEGPKRWRAEIEMPAANPAFSCGIIARLMELTGATPQVEVERVWADRFELLIRW